MEKTHEKRSTLSDLEALRLELRDHGCADHPHLLDF